MEDPRLTEQEKAACAEVAEKHGINNYIVENALYRVTRLGEKPPKHIMSLVRKAQKAMAAGE